jgi:hypothetical protein
VKFFLPPAKESADAEKAYDAIRQFVSKQMGAELGPERIYHVRGVHDGKPFTATVGEVFERLGEVVVAILFDTQKKCYLICTANRGVLGGIPYLSGSNEIKSVEEFEP